MYYRIQRYSTWGRASSSPSPAPHLRKSPSSENAWARPCRAVRLLPAVELQTGTSKPANLGAVQIEVETRCSIRLDVPVVADFGLPKRNSSS